MRWIYSIGIFAYVFAIRIASLFGNSKAKLWLTGRQNLESLYKEKFMNQEPGQYIWIHVSSLGEFEQGRPVIEALKKEYPLQKILLTFYSPSGYEIRKNYPLADVVLYLPGDSLRIMRKYVKLVRPALVVFVKYDFWFNFIIACHELKIPVIFIASAFRKNQYFFKWWAGWFRKQLQKVTAFFVQTQHSVDLLRSYGINQVEFAGDTRLDRVVSIRDEQREFPAIKKLISGRQVIVAGSTWPKDEQFLKHLIQKYPDVFFIIAPHDVSENRLLQIEKLFDHKSLRYSDIESLETASCKLLLIDSIGVLAFIYRYASVVYIGNGFGKGIHNILEPVVYGKPVIFGPNYFKFAEAVTLVNTGGAFSFSGISEMENIVANLLGNETSLHQASGICFGYVEQNKGATTKIVKRILELVNSK
jgi:3-deoxy-D-manno-octulosonic-acid transferase